MSLQSRTQSRAEADGPARSVRIQLVSESNARRRSPASLIPFLTTAGARSWR
jgi:hypothetical protein